MNHVYAQHMTNPSEVEAVSLVMTLCTHTVNFEGEVSAADYETLFTVEQILQMPSISPELREYGLEVVRREMGK